MSGESFGGGAHLYTLENEYLALKVTDIGASIVSLFAQDRQGKKIDVVLGYASGEDYLDDQGYYLGATIGRYANRLKGAAFTLDGQTYNLDKNNGENCLHSGLAPWSKRFFTLRSHTDNCLIFSLHSADLDQGFPGEVDLEVSYALLSNSVELSYHATAKRDTPLNITNHSYFNLNGAGSGDVLDHLLQIQSSLFTPTDSALLPDGKILTTLNTPLDFRREKRLGQDINRDYQPLIQAGGYDHNFVLDRGADHALRLKSEASGISLTVSTDYPGLQIYSGNYLCDVRGKNGSIYQKYAGLAIEPQYFPDSLHHSNFPSTLLKAGELFEKHISYHFTTLVH